jgi:hypothetical protein
MSEEKLTLDKLRSLRFPRRDRRGEVIWDDRFKWTLRGAPGQRKAKHWELTFDIDGWERYIELAPQIDEWEDGENRDPNWEQSEYVNMWLGNKDPNRFLVGISLHTLPDLTRFLDAFKLEYYRTQDAEKAEA